MHKRRVAACFLVISLILISYRMCAMSSEAKAGIAASLPEDKASLGRLRLARRIADLKGQKSLITKEVESLCKREVPMESQIKDLAGFDGLQNLVTVQSLKQEMNNLTERLRDKGKRLDEIDREIAVLQRTMSLSNVGAPRDTVYSKGGDSGKPAMTGVVVGVPGNSFQASTRSSERSPSPVKNEQRHELLQKISMLLRLGVWGDFVYGMLPNRRGISDRTIDFLAEKFHAEALVARKWVRVLLKTGLVLSVDALASEPFGQTSYARKGLWFIFKR